MLLNYIWWVSYFSVFRFIVTSLYKVNLKLVSDLRMQNLKDQVFDGKYHDPYTLYVASPYNLP